MAAVVQVDAEEQVDEAACYDDRRAHDAYNDVRYNRHVHDVVPVDEVHQAATAGAAVRADGVVAVRMQTFLISEICMRICIFSYYKECNSHTSTIND